MEKRYIGIDLHKHTFITATKEKNNDSIVLHSYSMSSQGIEQFLATTQSTDWVAIESSTHTFFMYDKIAAHVAKCIIVNPKKFKVISQSTSKTDRKDARLLAQYLSYENLLPEVYVPNDDIRQLRSLFSVYDLTKTQINQTRNRICALFLQEGINEKPSDIFRKETRDTTLQLPKSSLKKTMILLLFNKLDSLEQEKTAITNLIIREGRVFQKEIEILTSFTGISVLIALALIADIGDITRFKTPKHLCSYLGLVPKVDNSGKTLHNGSIHKDSRKLSRSLLTQSLFHFLSAFLSLKAFYEQKKRAKGSGKARIAVIRKMVVMIYYALLREQFSYTCNTKLHAMKMQKYTAVLKKFENIA